MAVVVASSLVLLGAPQAAFGGAPTPVGERRAPACGPSRDGQLTETPWPLRLMRPDLAWPISQGAGITVAVIDSGVSTTHPALEGKVLPGRDFVEASAKGQCDEAAHGTLVAGVIAGRQPQGSAFTGIAPQAAILPIRVLRDTKRNFDPDTSSNIASAIRWAADNGADVINMSLTTEPTSALESAVRHALDRNIVVVAAAGNDGGEGGNGQPAYPAAYDDVIAVAGVDEQGHHVTTSTAGPFVDVAAPGADVDGPMPRGNGYARFEAGGTSFAAAYVSGLAALIRSADPRLTPTQVARRITETAEHPPEGRNDQVGFGVINPYRALTALTEAPRPARPQGALAPIAAPPDPMRTTRTVAAWTATTLAGLAILISLVAAVVRRTRRRRSPADDEPSSAARSRKPDRRRDGPGGQTKAGGMSAGAATVSRNDGGRSAYVPAARSPDAAPIARFPAANDGGAGTGSYVDQAVGTAQQVVPQQNGPRHSSHSAAPGAQANFSGRAQVPPR